MIIRESTMPNKDGSYILEYTQPLYEHEMTFPAVVIPVMHNERTQSDLIQLESFLKFGKYNNITDGTLAVFKICESNNIPMDNIGFVVNEENLYVDIELAETYVQLCECNFPVYVKPISRHSIYYMKLNEALILDNNYQSIYDSEHIANYCLYSLDEEGIGDTVKSVSKKLAAATKTLADKTRAFKNETSSKAKVLLKNQIDKLNSTIDFLKNKLSELKS